MLTRRTLLASPLFAVAAAAQRPADARKRALVVGIDRYDAQIAAAPAAAALPVQRLPVHGESRDRRLENLDGSVNDARLVRELLISLYGFRPDDILLLENQHATAGRILAEFQRHLVAASESGDFAVFFYAGHGSQMANTSSDESDKLDDTLVPADYRVSPDIRDKELARLYRAAALKGVSLTVILDSCHSGGASRGAFPDAAKVRVASRDSRTVDDPPDRDPVTGKLLPDPSSLDVLVLAAAREDQRASEDLYDGAPHGAFTARLTQVLRSVSPNERADRIFQRVEALFRADRRAQQPQIFGPARLARGLLGQPPDSVTAVTVAVERVEGEQATLRAGAALGIAPGCLLRKAGQTESPDRPPLRVEVTAVPSLARSTGKISGSGALRAGDLLVLEKWVPISSRPLRFHLESNGPPEETLREAGSAIEALRARNYLTSPADEMWPAPMNLSKPSHLIRWTNAQWMLEGIESSTRVQLGVQLTPESLAAAVPNGARLLSQLPYDPRLAADLRAGMETLGVELVADPEAADYALAGQFQAGQLTYYWRLQRFFDFSMREKQLPLYTDRASAAGELIELAARLSKIHAWLTIPTPPAGAQAFPYRLTFEKVGGGEARSGQEVHIEERYKIILKADSSDLDRLNAAGGVAPRYVYVFAIAANGQADLIFPTESSGSNLFPKQRPTAQIDVSGRPDDFKIGPPEGHDSYFMLASAEPIPLAGEVFQWRSVVNYQSGAARGRAGGLADLLKSVGAYRGMMVQEEVPANWSLDRLSLVTVK